MTTKTLHATHRIDYEGAVDADGHILEPPDLWETYLEPRYRDRALRFVTDDDGLKREGKIDRATGKVKDKVGDASDKLKDTAGKK